MNDRDRLAADLHRLYCDRIGHPRKGLCHDMADRLIALGWTRLDVLAPVVTVEGPEEDGSYGVSIVAMPGHVGAAMTIAEAAVEAADAAEAWLAAYRDIDEERLARALWGPCRGWMHPATGPDNVQRFATDLAKAYREDTDA